MGVGDGVLQPVEEACAMHLLMPLVMVGMVDASMTALSILTSPHRHSSFHGHHALPRHEAQQKRLPGDRVWTIPDRPALRR
jgi:hypothetical protein